MRSPILYLLAALVTPVQATEYFVALNGNDKNNNEGSINRPFATLMYAASKAHAGDTIFLREGIYYPQVKIEFKVENSGTASNPIKIQNYNDEPVILDGSVIAGDNPSVLLIKASWLEFKGLTVRNGKHTCVSMYGGSHISFIENTIYGCWRGAFYPDGGATHLTFLKNVIYRNVQVNSKRTLGGGWPSALNLSDNGDVVEGNYVYENFGEGIGAYGENHVVKHNTVRDNYSVDLYLNNLKNSWIEGNFIYSYDLPDFYRRGASAKGISMANEALDAFQFENNTIVNNLVVGRRLSCLSSWNGEISRPLINSRVEHNTFACHTSGESNFRPHLFVLDSDGAVQHQGLVIKNNVFLQLNPAAKLSNTASTNLGATFQRNNWFGGVSGTHSFNAVDDINADPKLYQPYPDLALPLKQLKASFMPMPQSPLLFAAVPRSNPTHDLCLRALRTSSSEIGALDTVFARHEPARYCNW